MGTDKLKAYTLVIIQMICIGLILLTGWPIASHLILLIIQVAGVFLGIWAIITMGVRNTNATPLIKEKAILVTNGPYAFVRHPMYSAVLLTIWPLIIDQYSPSRLTVAMILTVDLVLKMEFEESLLQKHFDDYEAYMQKTKRLIPFIV